MESFKDSNDAALVEKAKSAPSGDLRAFEELIRRHENKVITNCRYISGSPDDAEDLAQNVFVKTFYGLPRFEGRSSFSTWILRIKTNHCLNFLRSKKRQYVEVDDPALQGQEELHVAPRAEKEMVGATQRRRIQHVLDQMPETLRVPLIMRDLDEMSYQEIAEALDIGLSAVKMRIKRGREEFKRLYGPKEASQESSPGGDRR